MGDYYIWRCLCKVSVCNYVKETKIIQLVKRDAMWDMNRLSFAVKAWQDGELTISERLHSENYWFKIDKFISIGLIGRAFFKLPEMLLPFLSDLSYTPQNVLISWGQNVMLWFTTFAGNCMCWLTQYGACGIWYLASKLQSLSSPSELILEKECNFVSVNNICK